LQTIGIHQFGQESNTQHFFSRYFFRGQEKPLRLIQPQSRYIAGHASWIEMQAELCRRHEHICSGRADPKVACQGQVRSSAVCAAVYRRNRDGPRVLDDVYGFTKEYGAGRVIGSERGNIVSAAEVLALPHESENQNAVVTIHRVDVTA